MRKLIFALVTVFVLIVNQLSAQTYQAISATAFSAVEFIGGEAKAVAPLNFQYNVWQSFTPESKYFYGVAAGPGISFNAGDEGKVEFNFIAGAYVGGQLFKDLPAMAIGPFRNFVSDNWGIMYNIHFSPTEVVHSLQRSTPRYKPLINDDYNRNNIGF